jgi:hypothetical protein
MSQSCRRTGRPANPNDLSGASFFKTLIFSNELDHSLALESFNMLMQCRSEFRYDLWHFVFASGVDRSAAQFPDSIF